MGLIQIDDEQIREMTREEIRAKLESLDIESEYVFWDVKKLCEKTCMSRSFIQKKFFWLPDFPKKKIDGKWAMLPEEVIPYLREWYRKQP